MLCIPDWFTKSAKYHHCSDHALLQSLVVLATPPRPRPCCAPALYTGLDILHLDPRERAKKRALCMYMFRVQCNSALCHLSAILVHKERYHLCAVNY